ncbi:MAG: hypothetical protein AMXMBFR56_60580 [Polyangiaceae bacterium]
MSATPRPTALCPGVDGDGSRRATFPCRAQRTARVRSTVLPRAPRAPFASTALGKVARPETAPGSACSVPHRDRGRAGWGRNTARATCTHAYVSYAYPAGMGTKLINTVEIPVVK